MSSSLQAIAFNRLRFWLQGLSLALALGLISSGAYAVSVENATISLVNKTKKRIVYAEVVHKYSNEYSERYVWTRGEGKRFRNGLRPNKQRAPVFGESGSCKSFEDCETVTYHTGALTTGRDWWFMTWAYEDDDRVYYSDPNNFRGAIDVLERIAFEATPIAVGALTIPAAATCTVATGGGCWPSIIASAAAIYASGKLAGSVFTSGSTKGFKQHILRGEDAGTKVKLYIYPNGKIKIKSKSGTSETVYSSYKPDISKPLEREINDKVRQLQFQ